DRDLLLFTCTQVLRRNIHNTVRVDIERNFDLRHSTRSRRNAHEVKLAESPVIPRHRPLTLKHVNLNRCLIVCGGGKDLALPRWNRRVAFDELRKDTAKRFDTERERRDVEQ